MLCASNGIESRELDSSFVYTFDTFARVSGFGADWHLASVEVLHKGLNKTFIFPCNQWLRKTKEEGVAGCCKTLRQGEAPGGNALYRVAVKTSVGFPAHHSPIPGRSSTSGYWS